MGKKHTPYTKGPWRIVSVKSPNGLRHREIVGDDSDFSVAREIDYMPGEPSEEEKANAYLIAAAPELLEACSRALPWIGKMIACGAHLNSVAPNDCIGAMEQLEAVIAKATGK